MKLTESHKNLLKILQNGEYCVPKINAIARKLKLPPTTVQSRVNKLKKEGSIKGFTTRVDPTKLDRKLLIFVVIKVFYQDSYSGKKIISDFAQKLAKIPEVQGVYTCSGDWDYLIKLRVKDTEHYNQLSTDKILPLGGIEKLESMIVYDNFKETLNIEL